MSFLDVMHHYFRGEKLEALGFILPLGMLLAAFGVVALKVERSGFTWGAGVPAVVLGVVLMATGLGVGGRTSRQVAELARRFEQEPAAMVREELPRMQKVDANFRATFAAFGVAAAVGLALVYGVRAEWAQGLGSVLVLAGALGLLVDGFASRRAAPYTAALEELAERHRVAPEQGR